MEIKKSATTKATAKKEEITYTVLEECGVLDTKEYQKKGEDVTETLRVRYIQWGNYEPKYDIRWWIETAEGEKCGKGVGLTGEQLSALKELLNAPEPKAKPKASACKAKRNATITKKK